MSAIITYKSITETYYNLLIKNDKASLQTLGSTGSTASVPRSVFEVDAVFPTVR